MGQPYVGEIRMVGFNFAPANWAFCNGQFLSISQNTVLFELIGTTYGGDGVTTYQLPNLQSRFPIHMGSDGQGNDYVLGETVGVETVTLNSNQIPSHTHSLQASASAGTETSPAGAVWAESALEQYSSAGPAGTMGATLGQTGGSQPHDNMPTFLTINYIISLFGVFPSQN
ncbi:MAG: tail fiber protein [Terracidiphilus sp.]